MLSRMINVPVADPDDARRRMFLNILLIGVTTVGVLALVATFVVDINHLLEKERAGALYIGITGMIVGLAVIFAINRYGAGWLASLIFLLLLTLVVSTTDEPAEVASGRSLFLFAIPILVASFALRPWASFITATLSSLVILFMDMMVLKRVPGVPAMLSFFIVALIAWLAASSLERTLQDLRTLNEGLEQRVKERTQDLAEALGKNQAILESIADGVIVFDNDGKATLTNPAVASLLDRSAGEVIGHDLQSLIKKEDVNAAGQEQIAHILEDRDTHHTSLKLEWGRKTLSMSLAPVRSSPGDITGSVAVFRDFTREAEIDRMKSALVSMVSHDLRTPLNAILGYAEILQEAVYGPLSEKQYTTMERIAANARRLVSLVNDLLDQAQIEAGRLVLKTGNFTPAELLDSVQSMMVVLAQTKGLELTSYIADDMPSSLEGDMQRLQQILVNLVGNALKFTEQGSVQVQIRRHDTSHWALQVIDSGPGIPADKMNHVFERFYQVDSTATRKHQGIGLGLSIVKQLVQLMGGEVNVQSKLGQGSTFTAILPFAPPASSA